MNASDDGQRLPAPREDRHAPVTAREAPLAGYAPEGEPEYDLLRFLAVIWRRKWLVLGGALPIVVLVAYQTYQAPKVYQSSTSILVETGRTAKGGPFDVLDRVGQAGQIGTELQLLTSRRVVEPAVDELDLHAYAETEAGPVRPGDIFPRFDASPYTTPGAWRLVPVEAGIEVRMASTDSLLSIESLGATFALGGATLRLPSSLEAPVMLGIGDFNATVKGIKDGLFAGQVHEEGNVIRLYCSGGTPQEPRDVCDAIARSYLRLRTDLLRMSAELTSDFLRTQVDRLADRLARAEDSLAAYETRYQTVALEERVSAEVRGLVSLKAERDLLEAERASLAAFLVDIEADPARSYRELATFPSLLHDPSMGDLVANLLQLENERSELAVRRTERNADLAAILARIEEVEAQMAGVARGYERGLRSRIASLDETLGSMRARLAAIPGQQVEMARLRRETTQLEDLYGFLESRLREAELAKEVEMPGVSVLDVATLPVGPVSPKVKTNLAVGLALGLAFGLTLGFYREYYDRRISGRLQAERETGLPVIGMIPNVASGLVAAAAQRSLRPGATAKAAAVEAFHSLAMDLRLVGREWGEAGIRSIAITSAAPKEGKTFTACNLALVHASFGLRTLIIDADMRASSVARTYGLSTKGPGLGEVLVGEIAAEAAWREVHVGGTGSLFVLPAGTAVGHPASLLETPAFAATVAQALEAFDVVVVDTPPLNVISDAASIASVVDAVLFVVRSEQTDAELVRVSLDRLARATRSVVGVVLNDVWLPEHYAAYGYGAETVS